MSEKIIPFTESAPLVRLLVTEKDLAVSLSVSVRHLRELRSQRLIPYIKLGRVVRYRMAEVERALTDHLTINDRFTDKGGAA